MDSLVEQAFEEMKSRLKTSEISMLPSRLVEKPQISRFNPGENWLALDFGGSFVKLGFPLGTSLNIDELRIQTIEDRNINLEFFDRIVEWICRQVEDVIRKRKLENCTKFHLAVAFSFPLNNSNQLLEVGKGYQIGEDIKHASITDILQQSFDKVISAHSQRFQVEVHGIVNDSVAVYIASRAESHTSDLSLILGTGINACFSMASSEIPAGKLTSLASVDERVLINSEIGSLGKNFIGLTQFDDFEEPLMPLEHVSSGKWLPVTLQKVLNQYLLLPESLKETPFDGKLFCEVLSGEARPFYGADTHKAREVALLLVERAATYVCCALLSSLRFVKEESSAGQVYIGYAGSFLQHCEPYRSAIERLSQGRLRLHYLDNSNLIGALLHSME